MKGFLHYDTCEHPGRNRLCWLELTRLLYSHPSVHIAHLSPTARQGQTMAVCTPPERQETARFGGADVESLAKDTDVFFTCLPHGSLQGGHPPALSTGKYIVDMSGDYRYNDASVYEAWYGVRHSSPELLAQSVYGLPELHREAIRKARLIGNPGCYTTCSIWAWPPCSSRAASAPIISSLTPNPAQPARAVASPRPCTSARPTSP